MAIHQISLHEGNPLLYPALAEGDTLEQMATYLMESRRYNLEKLTRRGGYLLGATGYSLTTSHHSLASLSKVNMGTADRAYILNAENILTATDPVQDIIRIGRTAAAGAIILQGPTDRGILNTDSLQVTGMVRYVPDALDMLPRPSR